MTHDFLDEMIEESTKRNPDFSSLMEGARQPRELLMNADDSKKYLQMLGAELQKLHITGEILLADDEMLLLDIKHPKQSVDIDAYFEGDETAFDLPITLDAYFGKDGKILRETTIALAKRENLPENWLQAAVQSLFFSESSQTQWMEYPCLRIYRPSMGYLLTVKVATGSLQDVVGIRKLAEALQITNANDMLVHITRYIPEQLLIHDIRLLVDQTFASS